MSARSNSFRGDGLNFPHWFATGATGLLAAPCDLRLRTVYAVAGVNATVVDVQVGGVSILARSNQPSGNVAANARVAFTFSQELIPAGTDFQFTTTDGGARFSAEFVRV